jgi:hypothetical protein
MSPYLAFPPKNGNVHHALFSWVAFISYSVLIAGILTPFTVRMLKLRGRCGPVKPGGEEKPARSFPWWGWAGVLGGLFSWFLAWTRLAWCRPFQLHTFTPLWLSFIVVINAVSYRRRGRCLMLDRPLFFLMLFPLSAAFWWFFEYLNRFVENWSYVLVPTNGWSYFWRATLPFSTVLAAVLSAREWFGEMTWVREGFTAWIRIDLPRPKTWAWVTLVAADVGLLGIGVWPNYLFSLLWVAPLLILLSLQVLFGEETLLSGVREGDWRVVVSSAAAALFCGWFWEMWNYYSLAKWSYTIPFVDRFRVFEMPILGYAGYLPFGLECMAIGDLLEQVMNGKRIRNHTPRRDGIPR